MTKIIMTIYPAGILAKGILAPDIKQFPGDRLPIIQKAATQSLVVYTIISS